MLAQISSFFFGAMFLLFGYQSYLAPHELVIGFGLPHAAVLPKGEFKSPTSFINPFIYVLGSRSIISALTLLYFGLVLQSAKATGATELSIAAVGFADAAVTARLGVREKAWTHGIGACVMTAVGACLVFSGET